MCEVGNDKEGTQLNFWPLFLFGFRIAGTTKKHRALPDESIIYILGTQVSVATCKTYSILCTTRIQDKIEKLRWQIFLNKVWIDFNMKLAE